MTHTVRGRCYMTALVYAPDGGAGDALAVANPTLDEVEIHSEELAPERGPGWWKCRMSWKNPNQRDYGALQRFFKAYSPDKTAEEIAAEIGCSPSYVRGTAIRKLLTLKTKRAA